LDKFLFSRCWTSFSLVGATPTLVISFLIWSGLVWPHIHYSMCISMTLICWMYCLIVANISLDIALLSYCCPIELNSWLLWDLVSEDPRCLPPLHPPYFVRVANILIGTTNSLQPRPWVLEPTLISSTSTISLAKWYLLIYPSSPHPSPRQNSMRSRLTLDVVLSWNER
jgi:hypothetical protein